MCVSTGGDWVGPGSGVELRTLAQMGESGPSLRLGPLQGSPELTSSPLSETPGEEIPLPKLSPGTRVTSCR